jgi:hypothetical protein
MKKPIIIASVIGVVLGYLGAKVLFVNSGKSLVIWATVGLVIGYLCTTYLQAIVTGAIYGFALSFFFMVFGYNGSESLLSRLPFFALLGLFGAVCGLVLALSSFAIKKAFAPKH